MSLNLSVIPGTNEEAYVIIFEITDHEYFPYLSSLLISPTMSTVSIFKSIFLDGEYFSVSRLIASNTLSLFDLLIL